MTRFFDVIKKYVPLFSLIVLALAFIAMGLNIAYSFSTPFADFMNGYISQPIRAVMAWITSIFSFSFAEFLLISSPVIVVTAIVLLCRRATKSSQDFVRCIIGVLSVPILVYVMFVFMFGAGYHTTTMEDKLDLERRDVSAEELYDTMTVVIDKLNALADEIVYAEDVGSLRPYSHDVAVKLCVDSYADLADKYSFVPKLNAPGQQIVLS